MRHPDFFIVGAPKCGTTALYEYLRQHPQIYMPFHKEPLFFGCDLTVRYGRIRLADYLDLFAPARADQRAGEASSWYLYSESAPREIEQFTSAHIIILLRNPVDMMCAQHSQLIFNRQEDIVDFEQAMAAEPERRQGRRIPPGPVRVENFFYRAAANFADQVERYLTVFGRDRVHVIIYDDLCTDAPGVYRRVLEFLGVDPTFTAKFALTNANKQVRWTLIQDLVYRPPLPLRRLIPRLRRYRVVHRFRSSITALNSHETPRPSLNPTLRKRLSTELAGDVERLGMLIGRDLSNWTRT
jgi:hypothetical protein